MKIVILAFAAILFSACYSPSEEGATEEKFSSQEQAIVVCSSDCAQPTYNGNPVACASNIYCYSDSAGAYCLNSNNTWSNVYCQANPTGPYCGDGICNGTETWQTCSDCAPPAAYCGDGVCNGGETSMSCPDDCAFCGNGVCERWNGEGGWNCQDCCRNGWVPCELEP